MARFKQVDGVRVELTAEEDAARDAEEAAVALYQAANGYKTERTASYASIGDQLDMQYHDLVDGTTTWRDHVRKVKLEIAKP